MVPVATAVFDEVLGERPNQVERLREEVEVAAADLLDTAIAGGTVTDAGLRTNVNVGIQYLASWLRGTGAAAIFNLMEDAATAEISRSQLWQWVHHGAVLDDGHLLTRELVRAVADEEMEKIRQAVGDDNYAMGKYAEARRVFEEVALGEEFTEFLTVPAYELIE